MHQACKEGELVRTIKSSFIHNGWCAKMPKKIWTMSKLDAA